MAKGIKGNSGGSGTGGNMDNDGSFKRQPNEIQPLQGVLLVDDWNDHIVNMSNNNNDNTNNEHDDEDSDDDDSEDDDDDVISLSEYHKMITNGGGTTNNCDDNGIDPNPNHIYSFRPMNQNVPKVLIPLCNKPLLQYTLEYIENDLGGCHIEELYIICSTEQVEQYLRERYHLHPNSSSSNNNQYPNQKITKSTTYQNQYKLKSSSSLKVHIIRDTNYITNPGDALRELDKLNVIQSDPFLLFHGGDLITNVGHWSLQQQQSQQSIISTQPSSSSSLPTQPSTSSTNGFFLEQMIEQHRYRKKNIDSSAIMTCLFVEQQSQSNQTNNNSTLLIGIDPVHHNRMVLYDSHPVYDCEENDDNDNNNITDHEKVVVYNKVNHQVPVGCHFLYNHTNTIEMYHTLFDLGIDICCKELLTCFTDAFDYRSIRNEFVVNTVSSEEDCGLNHTIYAHIIGNHNNNNNSGPNVNPTTTGTATTTSEQQQQQQSTSSIQRTSATLHPHPYYANRVRDLSSYSRITNDLLRRLCYPIVPDHFNHSTYEYQEHLEQKEQQEEDENKKEMVAVVVVPTKYKLQSHFLYTESCEARLHNNDCYQQQQQQSKDNSNYMGGGGITTVMISRTSIVNGPGCIGLQCSIGEYCTIGSNCLMGRNCFIGDHVQIDSCTYLWDHVTIEKNVIIMGQCCIGMNVIIRANSIIHPHTVIGPNCIIDTNVTIPPYTRITSVRPPTHHQQQKKNHPTSDTKNVVGPNGFGWVWVPTFSESDDPIGSHAGIITTVEEMALHYLQITSMNSNAVVLPTNSDNNVHYDDLSHIIDDGYSDNEDDDDMEEDTPKTSMDELNNGFNQLLLTGTTNNEPGSSGGVKEEGTTTPFIVGRQKGVDVVKELKAICSDYYNHHQQLSSKEDTSSTTTTTNNHKNLLIELNSFKLSQNATFADCTAAVTHIILERLIEDGTTTTTPLSDGQLVQLLQRSLQSWKPIYDELMIDFPAEKAIMMTLDQCATMSSTTTAATNTNDTNNNNIRLSNLLLGNGGRTFRLVIQLFHNEEILSDEAILAWAADHDQENLDEEEEENDNDESENGNDDDNNDMKLKQELLQQSSKENNKKKNHHQSEQDKLRQQLLTSSFVQEFLQYLDNKSSSEEDDDEEEEEGDESDDE